MQKIITISIKSCCLTLDEWTHDKKL